MIPAISVVLPFRNGGRHIAEAIDSILAQTLTDFELLAVDDGSSDASRQIVAEYARSDTRIHLIRNAGEGLPAALNTGVAASNAPYIARMDADDIARPERFSRQVAALSRDDRLVVVGSIVDLIDEAGTPIDVAWFPCSPQLIRQTLDAGHCCLCHPATMMRRDAVIQAGGYRSSVALAEDYDLWVRLSRAGDLRNLDCRLLSYRLHAGSASAHQRQRQLISLLRGAALASATTESERIEIETCTDVPTLIDRLATSGDPAETFVRMTAWYTENAALVGDHREAVRIAADLSTRVPTCSRRRVHARLRQAAAVTAAWRGDRLASFRYLLGAGSRGATRALVWSLVRPPELTVRVHPPTEQGAHAGYLDMVRWYENGATAVLWGWLPLSGGTLPARIVIAASLLSNDHSIRVVLRPDVARIVGPDHLHAGFRIVVKFPAPVDGGQPLRVWSSHGWKRWRELNATDTIIDR